MPSPQHDVINEWLRRRPALAVELLRAFGGADIPHGLPVRLERNDFNTRPSRDFQPDNVFIVGPPQRPVHGLILEIQRAKTPDKQRQLPRYGAALWLMLDCRVDVAMICTDADVAAYYAEPISTGLSGYTLRTVVLGPDQVPPLTDPDQVAANQDFAVLSLMMHGRDRKVSETFVAGLGMLPSDHASEYHEHVYNMLTPAVGRVLEEVMSSTEWPVYSPFAKKHFGQGKLAGREEGREEGRAEECARNVLAVLDARGLQVPKVARDRILSCTDLERLEAWLTRAATAKAPEELFDDPR